MKAYKTKKNLILSCDLRYEKKCMCFISFNINKQHTYSLHKIGVALKEDTYIGKKM